MDEKDVNNSLEEKSMNTGTYNKAVIKRLSIIIGQLEGIKRMLQDQRECSDVLIQLSAARSALNSMSKIILENHINHCIEAAVEKNDKSALASLNNALNKFIN
jgi:CsoR family transcriptional regulator, copper-sensing transcriptional repressor